MARVAVIVLILGVCLPEVLPARVVLEAGEIDSGKVRVGVFAEVVYGKGKRDPVSGRWEKLDTASGYIKAVDAEHLTIVLRQGFGKKRIAFARIQKLILAEPSGVVLKAGEIDSGKVRVGVFAEVVYGKGARDPVSGQWDKLVTASGYIKAVDAEHLTIALRRSFRKNRKNRIAFARIERLIIAESRREMGRLKDTLRRRKRPVSILQLSEGRRIRIHTRGMEERITARFHRVTRDTLFLQKWRGILGREKRPASIAITDISRLEVYKYHKSYAKPGAAIGAFAGIMFGLMAISDGSNEGGNGSGMEGIVYPFLPPVFGLMGAIGGALVGGVFFSHDVWQTVDYLSPSTVGGRHRLSYRLSFRF